MAHHDIVVIGASAGGVEAMTRLVRDLPPGLPASLFVVWSATFRRAIAAFCRRF